MAWHAVLVGVDASPAGGLAATCGWAVAEAARVPCHLVHAVREPPGLARGARDSDEHRLMSERFVAHARDTVSAVVGSALPAAVESLEIRVGNPSWILAQAVKERDAGLLVLGGKHHSAPARWLGGSTAHHAVRTIDVPLLVAAGPSSVFARVLVATDLSDAAAATIMAAQSFAGLFGATIRALHVVEPLPSIPDVGIEPDECAHLEVAEAETEASLVALGVDRTIEPVVQCGAPARTIADHVADWSADLVVVGSHGKGWIDRVLLGSTTERLLNRLPCSLLIIPVHGRVSTR